MKRTPQRSLLWLSLLALIWGAGLVALVWVDTEPPLLLTAWAAGAALLVLLAFYLGLLFRLDVLQVQQILRERSLDPASPSRENAPVSALWQPLIDAVSPIRPCADEARRDKARLDALALALEAERAQGLVWQRQAAQAEARFAALRGQVQDAAKALSSIEFAWGDRPPWPDAPTAQGETEAASADETDEAGQAYLVQLQALASAADEAMSALGAHAAAMSEREAAIQTYVDARAARSAQEALEQHRVAEQLAQTAEALTLLGLNLRLQLSHLAASPAADGLLLEQTEADLDALLAALGPMNPRSESVQDGQPPASAPWPTAEAPERHAAQARLLRTLQSFAQTIQAAKHDRERQQRTHEQRRQWQTAVRQQTADKATLQPALRQLREALTRAVQETID
ncbi:MAG: chemotaxis protein [Thiomonas sp.]|nr:chemotaxis protein [Thiomonas sp.]